MCSLLGPNWDTREVMLVARFSRHNVRVLHCHRCYGSFRPQLRGLGTSAMAEGGYTWHPDVSLCLTQTWWTWLLLLNPSPALVLGTDIFSKVFFFSKNCMETMTVFNLLWFGIWCSRGGEYECLSWGRKALQFGGYVPAFWRNLLPEPLVSFWRHSLFRPEGYVYRSHTDFVLFDTLRGAFNNLST